MSARCKVCNTAKNTTQDDSNMNWECQICGNLLDPSGNIATV